MNRCKRCNKPCSAISVFCDECRTLLQDQFQTEESIETSEAREKQETSLSKSSLIAMSSTQENGENSNVFERNTSPIPAVQGVHTPLPPVFVPVSPSSSSPSSAPEQGEMQQTYNMVEQALQRLNEAARRIAQSEGEQQGTSHHPRASRLTPLRDISAEIQRESTPLPNVLPSDAKTNTNTNAKSANANIKGSEQGEDLARRMPDLWPWMQDPDTDDNDVWANRTDPLLARRFPTSGEAERIEQEDLRRIKAEGWTTRPLPRSGKPRTKRAKRLRLAFAILASLAVLALLVDGLLASLAFIHTQHRANAYNGPPTLTLSSNVAIVGQTITLHVRSFSPSTQVYLTHDIQQPVATSNGTGLIRVGAMGDANVPMLVDASWGPGFHIVYAEDVKTRYTASSTLQIVNSGSTRPSHLDVGSPTIELGAGFQGSNTIQPLTLHNTGDGSITWSASSNRPWLLISPPQGTFSASQTIEIAVERYNLKPGDYDGSITFSSNVGAPVHVNVQMTVRPLPANAGAVLAVTPAVLSFTGLDGAPSPSSQVLTINNPGSQPLYWSLASNTQGAFTFAGEDVLLHLFGAKNWLSTDQTSGVVEPGGTDVVHVLVNSQIILPGVYTDNLVFTSSGGTIDSPQDISVSLTVLPRCGLTLSSWGTSFTTVIGQGNPSNQALGLSATSSCTSPLNWNAQTSASWLTLTPASGQLKGAASTVTAIGVNTAGLKAGSYQGTISFLTGTATQTVVVSLLVQSPPSPVAPIMAASPLNLNFSATQGATNPPGQVVTITNNGGGTLYWRTSVNQLASAWLGASPTGGAIGKGQTGQVTVNVATSTLTPGTYVGQIVLSGSDASNAPAGGSPQTIAVNLLVLPTCSMAQPSSSTLTFNATTGSTNPAPQPLSITASGNCGWPLNWQASITGSARWLLVSSTSGLITASGQSATISVSVNASAMAPGKYLGNISIAATDSSGAVAQGSPQVVAVTLIVQSPCSLQVSAGSLTFSAPQGQAASQQSLTVSEAGHCARPVSWTAASDGGSASWLSVSPASGSDGGSGGTIIVSVSAANLIPGNFAGSITLSAKDSGGAAVQGSPQTVSVNLTVTGFNLSGSVVACADSTCATPAALPGATVTLLNSASTQVATVTADGSGNFSFSNLPSGSYTLSVTGTLSATSYTGTQPVTLSGNQSNIMVDVLPG